MAPTKGGKVNLEKEIRFTKRGILVSPAIVVACAGLLWGKLEAMRCHCGHAKARAVASVPFLLGEVAKIEKHDEN